MIVWALSASLQNSGDAAWSSSSAMRRRLPAMSKMPPEDLQAALQLRQAFAQRTDFHGAQSSTATAPSVYGASGFVSVK
jgi:hypothetical protein